MEVVRTRSLIGLGTRLGRELKEYFDRIEKTPATHSIKGMYVAGLEDTLRAMGATRAVPVKAQQFRDYPLRDYMESLLDASVTLFPSRPMSDALKLLGEQAIPTFASSIVGSVIMGTVGGNWALALKCVSRGYEVSLKPGKAVVAEISSGRARVELRDVWNFGESYQVGVIRGLMQQCGLSGDIVAEVKSQCDVDLRLEWIEKSSTKSNRRMFDRAESPR
jgi:uncharacterized protein (TIGR02265 family)